MYPLPFENHFDDDFTGFYFADFAIKYFKIRYFGPENPQKFFSTIFSFQRFTNTATFC